MSLSRETLDAFIGRATREIETCGAHWWNVHVSMFDNGDGPQPILKFNLAWTMDPVGERTYTLWVRPGDSFEDVFLPRLQGALKDKDLDQENCCCTSVASPRSQSRRAWQSFWD